MYENPITRSFNGGSPTPPEPTKLPTVTYLGKVSLSYPQVNLSMSVNDVILVYLDKDLVTYDGTHSYGFACVSPIDDTPITNLGFDAVSVWLNSNHTDQFPNGVYVSDLSYDSTKTYKVLYLVKANGTKLYEDYLRFVLFSVSDGKVSVRITENSDFIQIARIVFYEVYRIEKFISF